MISVANCLHCIQCKPSTQQQLMSRSRSGKYVQGISDNALFVLCNMFKSNGRLKSNCIKSILTPIWPTNKNISKSDVFNIRKKIISILPNLEKYNTFELFQKNVNTSTLLEGIDDCNMSDDDAINMATEVWKNLINGKDEDGNGNDSLLQFKDYFEVLAENAKGFSYELSYDTEGVITGVIWQTATMRDNFERFGAFICLDMMKRGINKLLWPYVSVAMYNDLEEICIGCKGIMTAERIDRYLFALNFMYKQTTAQQKEDVKVVAGDSIFDKSITETFGLPNAKFMIDNWHYFTKILPDR